PLDKCGRPGISDGPAARLHRKFRSNGLHSTLNFLACLRFDLRCGMPPRLAEIGIKTLGAAHAASRGRLFEHIVRRTWRIAASAERPELAAVRDLGARLARVRHLVTIETNKQTRAKAVLCALFCLQKWKSEQVT